MSNTRTESATALEAIPTAGPDPSGAPLIEVKSMAQSLMRLTRRFGPIFQVDFGGGRRAVFVSGFDLVDEICDESRFDKRVHADLKQIRDFAGDGLFTARTEEPNWAVAHRLLMPAFGPIAIRGMFDEMYDIVDQMALRWERFGPRAVIDVSDDMTRLTLDTIALCAFSDRFNSFYSRELHPFVGAMGDALVEAGERARRPDLTDANLTPAGIAYAENVRLMNEIADQLIAERRNDPDASSKKDLLGVLLDGVDPVTGQSLSDENIRYQLVTFLIAGHETTSGMLAFAFYLLVKNPKVLAKARAEVDAVFGDARPTVNDVGKLRYVEQVLMETLRIWPTAPSFALRPLSDTVIGGRYQLYERDTLFIITTMLHRDPAVWKGDVEAFEPERFDAEALASLPGNAWKPFGNGQRACIGRPFAMQEAKLVLATILQRFDLIEDDPSYQLRIKETLTIKPDAFRLRVVARRAASSIAARPAAAAAARASAATPGELGARAEASAARRPLLVLYGTNTGSSEAFARQVVGEATAQGFAARLAPLDDAVRELPRAAAAVIICSSYEGQPPDNARSFLAWLESAEAGSLANLNYGLLGCGNRQWARTYQAVPKRIEAALIQAGARAAAGRGEADAGGDFFGAFEEWLPEMWQGFAKAFGEVARPVAANPRLQVEVVRTGRSAILRQGELAQGVVLDNHELVDMTSPFGRSKRHIEIRLPPGMSYRAGDYLSVLPRNPFANVERVLRRFQFPADAHVLIQKASDSATTLPTGYPVGVGELLANYVELSQPATRSQVAALAESAQCPPDKKALSRLATEEGHVSEVLGRRVSVLDLLERFASCDLPFSAYLEMLPPIRARQYSIASSPLADPSRCSLVVAVVDAPALSGHGRFRGMASSLLAACAPGTQLAVAVRASNVHFHPPSDPRTPMIMVCAGTGLAPFRGFLEERSLQAQAGLPVARSLLFFGCDHPDVDFIYREQLEAWQAQGVVDIRSAFYKAPVGDVSFVQHRLWQDRADISELFLQGASIFVCGDGRRMAPAVRDTFIRIYEQAAKVTPEAAELWFERIERDTGRYVSDVFA